MNHYRLIVAVLLLLFIVAGTSFAYYISHYDLTTAIHCCAMLAIASWLTFYLIFRDE